MDVILAGIAQCHERTVGSTGDSRNTIVLGVFFRRFVRFVFWSIKQFELRHNHTATTIFRIVVHSVDFVSGSATSYGFDYTTHASEIVARTTNQWQLVQTTNFFSSLGVGHKVDHIFASVETHVAGESGWSELLRHIVGEAEENRATVLFRVAVVENVGESIFKRTVCRFVGSVVLTCVSLTGIHTHSTEVFGMTKQAVCNGWNLCRTIVHTSRSQHLILVAQTDISHFLIAGIVSPSLQLIVLGRSSAIATCAIVILVESPVGIISRSVAWVLLCAHA